jgi:signal transduction histidine kinase
MPAQQPRLAVSRLTVPLLIGLVAAVVGVSAVLAYEAYTARHSMRVTAERALAQYAAMAAWEFEAAVNTRLQRTLNDLFAPVLSGVAASPYERTPEPELLLPRAAALGASCGSGPTVLRVDLSTERTTSAGGGMDAEMLRNVMQGIQQQLRSTSASATRFLIVLDSTRSAFAAVGIRTARYGAPIAAYAIPDCGGALLRSSVAAALSNDPLLPAGVRGGMPNDSLVAVEVSNAHGTLPFASDSAAQTHDAMRQPLAAFPGVVATVALRPAARGFLLVSPPERSRLPLLLGLLLLCVVLALVALIQLRREHELARLRADFTSSVSHELRTPLAQILLFGETLNLGRARSEEERALASTSIVREARRLMHMVENVLHFSQRREEPDVRLEVLELQPYLHEVVASFTPLAAAAHMHVDIKADDLSLRADPLMLRQVLLNLLDNAVKYGRPGQTITIAASLADSDVATLNGNTTHRAVRLTVSDEGPGIPASDRERVWSPYVRLRSNGTPRRTGSGIGLAVVRELVAAMRGRTWVEPAHADGTGAMFVVVLPSASEPEVVHEAQVADLTSKVTK